MMMLPNNVTLNYVCQLRFVFRRVLTPAYYNHIVELTQITISKAHYYSFMIETKDNQIVFVDFVLLYFRLTACLISALLLHWPVHHPIVINLSMAVELINFIYSLRCKNLSTFASPRPFRYKY